MADYNIFSGDVSSGIILNRYEAMTVWDGGTATATTVNDFGSMYVYSGGTANSTTLHGSYTYNISGYVEYYGMYVSYGGVANNTTVASNGNMFISAGATANDTTVVDGGACYINGTANDTTISGGFVDVGAGGTANKITVVDGGLEVSAGGTVNSAALNTFYSMTIYSKGTANDTTVNAGVVWCNGTANRTVINGGEFNVDPFYGVGATANSVTVNHGGVLRVYGGYDSIVDSVYIGSATQIRENGGYVSIVVYDPIYAYVTFVPNAFGGLTINDYGSASVHSGTTATDIAINSGGWLQIWSGGTANDTTVNNGGYLSVLSGGTATDIIASKGAHLSLALASDTFIQGKYNGSAFEMKTSISDCTVSSGIGLVVCSGCRANDIIVESGGYLYVSSGGTADSVTVNSSGGLYVSSGGTAAQIRENGGYVKVEDGANVSFLPNSFNGLIVYSSTAIHSGTTATDITVNSGGWLGIYSGGTANSATVNSGGRLNIRSGGTAAQIRENGGYVNVEDGASVSFLPNSFSGLTVYSSAVIHSGTTANSTTIQSLGEFHISSGGTANDTFMSGGSLTVYNGGVANRTTISSGNINFGSGVVYVRSGGTVNSTTVQSGAWIDVSSGGAANNTCIGPNGSMFAYSGCVANDTTVSSGALYLGYSYYGAGGTANRTTILSGAWVDVSSGGTANETVIDDMARMYVYSGGTANVVNINSGGSLYLGLNGWANGGLANSTTVNSGGRLFVESGGTANGLTVNSDARIFVSGNGKLTGKVVLLGGVISAFDGATLDFNLTQVQPGAEARVSNLRGIQGMPNYTLTVSGTQAGGTYTLAEGAAEFDCTISVQSTSGEKLGTLMVGETVKVGYNSCTLNRTEDVLSVTVEVPDLTPTEPTGTAEQVSWETTGANGYIVEYSIDNFEHVIQVVTTGSAIDMPELPAGIYQWRVKADANSEWAVGEPIVSEADPEEAVPKVVQAVEDGSDDLFFATANGTWSKFYFAQHVGSINDWTGTNEIISASGKGRIQNLFFGSADPNVLCLTDGENGDAIFVDDVYTELPEEIGEQTARLYRIQEIRAGAGDDIVDMTSQQFEYIGDGLTIRGGAGDDVIWANKGNNMLFGDAGNDRIVGASGDDVIVGGIGDDNMHGGGGSDLFTFCENFGTDTVQQIESGSVTLWFVSGDESNWDAGTLTYTDGENSVKVSGVTAEQVTLKFGADDSDRFAELTAAGAFFDATTERIFEESGKGMLASL